LTGPFADLRLAQGRRGECAKQPSERDD
jgi:hypothetical protein